MEELTGDECQQAEAFMRGQPRPRDFDDYGLRFDLSYLTNAKYSIITLPLEYMAIYADRATYAAVTNDDVNFVRERLDKMPRDLAQFNATNIGSLARIACYCKNDGLRGLALGFLNELEKWYQANLQVMQP